MTSATMTMMMTMTTTSTTRTTRTMIPVCRLRHSFRFFFEEILKGRSGRGYRRAPNDDSPYRRPRTPETPEEAEKKAERKAFEARMREKERKEAEERQKAKAACKKAEAENQRQRAAQTAQAQQQRVQTLRSATFTAARAGDAVQVKKGVWEDEVDLSGGEIKMGCEKYVVTQPEDPKETLLHIAAQKGDVDLVKWLDAHSADPEERNSVGLSACHIALQKGHVPILKHFFESYDPKEEDYSAIYSLSPSTSLLSVALESAEPEVVWMILENGLANTQDIGNAWTDVTSLEGKQALLRKMGDNGVKYTEIQNLLMSYGGFTPPPTPKATSKDRNVPPTNKIQPPAGSPTPRGGFQPRGRGAHHRFKTNSHHAAQAQSSRGRGNQTRA
ncbi:hypothetical protein BDN67DRAFT_135529 [Paxillus ammoniavirescens]|nr:hypothetical protein BDN67DRAFT_135529 [Paxillus ammoniavirescens]